MKYTTIENVLYSMIIENTGQSALDSGGAYGRNWQKNAKLSKEYFNKQAILEWDTEDAKDSKDIVLTVNIYPYLSNILELDEICNEFNSLECNEWDSEYYGISLEQEDYLINTLGLEPVNDSFNTYDGESFLSQVLQGQYFKHEGNDDEYVLLQIHGGCDVRGGYTNAKLFKMPFYNYIDSTPYIYGHIGDTFVSTGHNGYCLTEDNTGNAVPLKKGSKIELDIGE